MRTGTGRFWGEDGADHKTIADHDSAGPDLAATRWLVEDQGAVMVGSDTSGYEVNPPPGHPARPSPSTATCWSTRAFISASSTTSRG